MADWGLTIEKKGNSINIMEDNLRKEIEKMMETNKNSSLDMLNQKMQELVDKHNNTGRDDFDGLSPAQMSKLLYFDCNENMIKIKDEKGTDIPLLKQIKYFLNIVADQGEIKLTKAGYLPPTIVKGIYSKGYLADRFIELGISKLVKESDSETITLTNILCQLSGLTKKRDNKISLTKKGKKTLATDNFLSIILSTFVSKFDWSYFDMFRDEEIGQLGAYYSIYLLNKYGGEKRKLEFYANKYFEALFKEYTGTNVDEQYCYTVRTFDRFLDILGFWKNMKKTGLLHDL